MTAKDYYQLDPQTYNDQFWWKTNDIEFWKNLFKNKNKTILELAAGTGRIGIPLVKEGFNYVGIDISESYCNYASQQFKKYTNQKVIYNEDMKEFDLKKKFDFIFIGFNSWLHLLIYQDAKACLKCIKKHMHQTTKLYIDIFVPSPLFLYRPKDVAVPVLEFFDSIKKEIIYIDEIIDYNKKEEIIDINWLYKNKQKYFKEFNFKMKMYYPDSMINLLTENNFIINNIWGDYEKNKFNENSNLQIYDCQLNI